MFDTTVFNRIALHLAEIAAQLKKANELKQIELNRYTQVGPITTVPTPAPSPQVGWPTHVLVGGLSTRLKAKTGVKEPWPFPTNDKP